MLVYQRVNIDTPWLQLSHRGGDGRGTKAWDEVAVVLPATRNPCVRPTQMTLPGENRMGKSGEKLGRTRWACRVFFSFFDVWFVTGFGLSLSGELVAGLSRRNIHSESWAILGVTLTFLLIINGLNYWRAWNMVLSRIGLSKNSVITMIRYASFNFP